MIFRPQHAALCAALCFLAQLPAAAQYPPLTTEISSDHPLCIFAVTSPAAATGGAYATELSEAWEMLPGSIKPYAVLLVNAPAAPAGERVLFYHDLLPMAQQSGIPVVLGIDGDGPGQHLRPDDLESLFATYTVIRGVETRSPRFDVYPRPGAWPGLDPDQAVLIDWIERCARFGRFLHLPLSGLHWPRMMAAPHERALYDKLLACKGYVLPGVWTRGEQVLTQQSAVMGLWLEGATQQWSMTADTRWFRDAQFIAPGIYGSQEPPATAPAELYRLMLLNGAMGGACVYAFPEPADLWLSDSPVAWEKVIQPTLEELLTRGAIARSDFVLKAARVACQLQPAADPQAFHVNLGDIDPVLDKGLLFRAAYGGENPGLIPELSLNRSGRFWVPLLSPWASDAAKAQFATVVPAGSLTSPEVWDGTLSPHAAPTGPGDAFVAHVGRAIFVFNTLENGSTSQAFTIIGAPTPVRTIDASREAEAIVLSWPFRESDVSYSVLRRTLPSETWEPLASGLAERTYRDAPPDPQATYAYTVTALTNEMQDYAGSVAPHEYRLFSAVESRVAEEVVMSPVLTQAQSVATDIAAPPPPAESVALVPPAAPVPAPAEATQDPAALAEQMRKGMQTTITERLGQMQKAFALADLEGLMEVHAPDYLDPQGWNAAYVRRAYRWFFDHYRAPRMRFQVRSWNLDAADTQGRITMRLYVRLTGYAVSDASGIFADVPAALPLAPASEINVTWVQQDGTWRILSTDPALPNMHDLLGYSAGPYERFTPGPDTP